MFKLIKDWTADEQTAFYKWAMLQMLFCINSMSIVISVLIRGHNFMLQAIFIALWVFFLIALRAMRGYGKEFSNFKHKIKNKFSRFLLQFIHVPYVLTFIAIALSTFTKI